MCVCVFVCVCLSERKYKYRGFMHHRECFHASSKSVLITCCMPNLLNNIKDRERGVAQRERERERGQMCICVVCVMSHICSFIYISREGKFITPIELLL